MSKEPKPPKPTFDPEYIRDVSERVYRARLEQESPGGVERMIAKDDDGGKKLRGRAAFYDGVTRTYLKVFGFEPAGPNDRPSLLAPSPQATASVPHE